jgi:class I fructose-bisphosphate aldolase
MRFNSPGKITRYGRIFEPASNRTLIVALDHGLVGNLPGIENLPATLDRVLSGGPDGVVISAGAMTSLSERISGQTGIVLTIDTFLTTSIPRSESIGEIHKILCTAEEALCLGADAVKMFLIAGQEKLDTYADNVASIARTARSCEKLGVPLIVEPTLWGGRVDKGQEHDARLIGHVCRIAYECGADILKIPYPGSDALKEIVDDIPCPILIMGGSKFVSDDGILSWVQEAISVGARGIVFGQNIWQREEPASIIQKLMKIVHSS